MTKEDAQQLKSMALMLLTSLIVTAIVSGISWAADSHDFRVGPFRFYGISTTITATGAVTSTVALPGSVAQLQGVPWHLTGLRAHNASGSARSFRFVISDQDGTDYIILPSGGAPTSVSNGNQFGWAGDIVIPPGWQIELQIPDALNTESFNWQFLAWQGGERNY